MTTNSIENKRSYMQGYINGMRDVLNDSAIERYCELKGIENSEDGINLIQNFDIDCYADEIFELIDTLLDILHELERADKKLSDDHSSDEIKVIMGHEPKSTEHYDMLQIQNIL